LAKKQFKVLKNLRKQRRASPKTFFPPAILTGLKRQCATWILKVANKQGGDTGNM
jgi:hypothetical protein